MSTQKYTEFAPPGPGRRGQPAGEAPGPPEDRQIALEASLGLAGKFGHSGESSENYFSEFNDLDKDQCIRRQLFYSPSYRHLPFISIT